MCVEESTADSTLQLPQELKDTWHEVIFRSFQLLSSLYSGNGTQQQCFNRLQLLSPAVVLWDKFRFDRKYINAWKQQFIEALNEEVVVRKVTSSNTEVFMLRNYSDISLSRTSVPSTCSSNGIVKEEELTEKVVETGPERAQEVSEMAILGKRSRSTLEDSSTQEDYTYEEVIDLLPPMYKKTPIQKVTLSDTTISKAPLLKLQVDGLTVQGEKGYRSIHATHGVWEGDWYFEVDILPGEGNVRIGWCTIQADMEAPIGYDKYGYSIRDKTGELYHEQRLVPFGEPFGEGDTIGCFLHLPPTKGITAENFKAFERKWIAWTLYFSSPRRPNWHQQETYKPQPPQIQETTNVGYMEFFKNGQRMGSSIQGIEIAKWYPAVALYRNARVTCNFGPQFQYPNIGHVYKPISSTILET